MARSIYRNGSARRRPLAFALAIAAHVVVILLLFRLAPALQPPPLRVERPNTFSIYPDDREVARPSRERQTRAKRTERTKAAAAAPPAATNAEPPPTPPPPVPAAPSLFGDKSLFAGADIGKLGRADGEEGDADAGKESTAAYGPGEGPGGAKLYSAEWYREPPRGVLTAYMPPSGAPAGSWAMVACRTVPDFKVDNCRSLGESPLGSGLARALREAAWQFRVRPPRIGGKALVGAWVRIRFDFTAGGDAVARRG